MWSAFASGCLVTKVFFGSPASQPLVGQGLASEGRAPGPDTLLPHGKLSMGISSWDGGSEGGRCWDGANEGGDVGCKLFGWRERERGRVLLSGPLWRPRHNDGT